MSSSDYTSQAEDYQRVEQAIQYLEANYPAQPSLAEIANSINLSEYHFQRLFSRWAGVSPKRFLQYLTKQHAKKLLDGSASILDAAYETGLSGPGRLHDLLVTWEAVSPGEYKNRGAGIVVAYGFHPSPFGECLLALTPRGISDLVFIQGDGRSGALIELRRRWQKAELREDRQATQAALRNVFAFYDGSRAHDLSLHLCGTPFQIKVWEALLHVPSGSVVAYQDLAIQIGLPGGSRAVGSAVGRNPLPVLIPCHRVIRRSGELGGYRWGLPRKEALLGWELVNCCSPHGNN